MAPATAGVVGAIEGGGADETVASRSSRRRGDGLGKVGEMGNCRWGLGDIGSVDLKFFEPPAPRMGGREGQRDEESTRERVVKIFI